MNRRQRKTPAATGAGKNEAGTASSYPAAPVFVKLADTMMACGICSYYREGRRKFCAFLGETVSPSDACLVHPDIIAGMTL